MKTVIQGEGENSSRPKIDNFDEAEEQEGSLGAKEEEEDKLMNSIMQDDQEIAEDGKILEESINQNVGAFIPDMMFSKIVQDYKSAKQIFGDRLLRAVSGYTDDFIEKNAKVPEFQKELKSRIGQKVRDLQDKNLLDKEGVISKKGYKLASLMMYTEELDKLEAKGFTGKTDHKEKSHYGGRDNSWNYKKGDRFADIDVMKTIKTSVRRGHKKVLTSDLKIFERESKGNIELIYAIDASGSMKGQKIEVSKKAGVALSYKAIENKDKVGLVVFGSEVKEKVPPTTDFFQILTHLSEIRANKETNFAKSIETSLELFSKQNDITKHLVFITDGLPTAGENPEKEALDAISQGAAAGITISMIGINIEEDAKDFMLKAVEIGKGRFYFVHNLDELDSIVLQDYYNYAE